MRKQKTEIQQNARERVAEISAFQFQLSAFLPWRALLLVLGIGVFYIATIREGHVWGDDHAAYIAHAKNIVEGRNYGDIGYVRSPSGINPQMYPPGYPLLLAPVYYFFGLDLTPMKMMNIGFFCAALFLFYLLIRKNGNRIALITVAVIGACPYFWDFKDTIASEFPFLALAYGALLVGQQAGGKNSNRRSQVFLGIAAGVLCGLAYATRNVGIVLPPAICMASFIATRKITPFAILTIVGFAGIAAGQKLLFDLQSDYLTPLLQILSVRTLLGSPWYYFKCLAVPWDNGYSDILQMLFYAVLVGFALYGAWLRCRQRWTSIEFFSLFYLALIVLFPWGGRRYLIPVMPVFVFYALVGMRALTERWFVASPVGSDSSAGTASKFAFALPVTITLAVLATFGLKYSTLPWRGISDGLRTPGFTELVEYLRQEPSSEAPVVFSKARLLALYTGTAVADGFTADNSQQVLDYYHRIGSSRFVVQQDGDEPANALLRNFVIAHPNKFTPEKQFGAFHIFKFTN